MDALDDARRWRRVVAGGPLAPFSEGLRGALAGQGYASDTVTDHVHLLADLSGWLGGQGLDAAGLTAGKAEAFLRDRRSRGFRTGVSPRAIAPILGYLRSLGAAPPRAEPPRPRRWSRFSRATGPTCPVSAGSPNRRRGTGEAGEVVPEAARRPLRELMDDRLLDALLERSRDQAGGLRLTGEGSMLGELVRAVLERALESELTAHLGYGRGGRGQCSDQH
jgi:hypothetical protein